MAKRVLVIVVVLVVAICAYIGYNSYDARRAGATGEVFSNDPPAGKTTKAEAGAKASEGTAASTEGKAADSDGAAIVYPAPAAQGAPAQAADATGSQVAQPGQPEQGGASAPEGDTINPNPPNGMVFAGKGKYQLYRQGNITWRVNTETGQSCILFATDDEWKKPKVYRAGCGSSR